MNGHVRVAKAMILGAVSLVLVAACTSSANPAAPNRSSVSRPSALTSSAALSSPAVSRSLPPTLPSGLASADYTGTGTAHGCLGEKGSAIVTLTANPDGMQPNGGCIQVAHGQRIRIVNNTSGFEQVGAPMTVMMRGLPTITIGVAKSYTYPKSISAYLAPGQHFGTCTCEPGSQFDIWPLS